MKPEAGQLWESHANYLDQAKALLYVVSSEEKGGHRGLALCYCMAGAYEGTTMLWTLTEGFYRRVA